MIALPECPPYITVKAGLTPSTEYYWFVKDKFDNRYYGKVTTDETGNFDIQTGTLPIGLFSAHAGTFELTVKTSYTACNDMPLAFCSGVFTCVKMAFVSEANATFSDGSDSGSGDESITIPCNCGEESEEGE